MFRVGKTLVSEFLFVMCTGELSCGAMNASWEGMSGSPRRVESVPETQSVGEIVATGVSRAQRIWHPVSSGAVQQFVVVMVLCCG